MGRHETSSRRGDDEGRIRKEIKDEPRSPRSPSPPRRHRDSPSAYRKRKESPRHLSRSPNRRRQRSRSRSPDRQRGNARRESSRGSRHRDQDEDRPRDDTSRNRNRKRDGSSEMDSRDLKPVPEATSKKDKKMIWGKPEHWEKPKTEEIPPEEKEKVNLGLSGKLAADTNTFRGVVIKYNEPPEAKIPKTRWRLYPFKGDENLPTLYIHRQSAYLVGRDRVVADLAVDHPSCSKQHAVLQYRSVPYTRPDGTKGRAVRPYIIDLSSGNGTFLNGEKVEPQRYYELKEKDVIKFGFSSREYVILSERAAENDENGDADTPDE